MHTMLTMLKCRVWSGILPEVRRVVGLTALAAAEGLVFIIDEERLLIRLGLVREEGIHEVIIDLCIGTAHYCDHQALSGRQTSIWKSAANNIMVLQ